ncbi:MAG: DUF547 domain-containing protein [Litorimonas sp.]
MPIKNFVISLLIVSAFCLTISNAYSQSQPTNLSFSQFTPNPKTQISIDYDTMDLLLQNMVLPTGPSTRQSAPRPQPPAGTRIVISHTSPYRLEGNKIAFYNFSREYTAIISNYRHELEDLSSKVNIEQMPRNEQLAYWFNLHNITMIEQIALAYPVKIPTKIKVNVNNEKVLLNDAKILSINGTNLSLRDIRENIVYKYWEDSIVQYGFFLGNLGSPTIDRVAFSSSNLSTVLKGNASEFTNSLRGFDKGRISLLYQDNAKFFFPDFQSDIRSHLKTHMRPEVAAELKTYTELKVAKYEYIIADMTGGSNNRTQGVPVLITQNDSIPGVDLPPRGAAFAYIREIREKQRKLRDLGLSNRGTVVIQDIETPSGIKKSNIIN